MIHLILSLDYEIFGNGAGDVMRDVVQPTHRVLRICDRHSAKMTIMFEVGEYWAFKQYDSQLQKDLGYSPCELMKRQAIDAVRRGHDVQLHLHPQWIGARYDKGEWQLCNSYWRLADLPAGLGSKSQITSITGALHAGKETLENMIKPVEADYGCVCFRAGGFYAQPSENIISAMKRVGVRADSSVVKGYKADAPFAVDYSHAIVEKGCWWTSGTELTMEGRAGENVLELPVSCRMESYWKNFKVTKLRATIKRRKAEKTSRLYHQANGSTSSIPKYHVVLRNLVRKHASTFDFCKLSSKDMLDRIGEYVELSEQPVVAIGHSKDFFNDRGLDQFLATVKHDKQVVFLCFSEFIERKVKNLDHER